MTDQQIEAFRKWHAQRLVELRYPREIVKELTYARETWISKLKVKSK